MSWKQTIIYVITYAIICLNSKRNLPLYALIDYYSCVIYLSFSFLNKSKNPNKWIFNTSKYPKMKGIRYIHLCVCVCKNVNSPWKLIKLPIDQYTNCDVSLIWYRTAFSICTFPRGRIASALHWIVNLRYCWWRHCLVQFTAMMQTSEKQEMRVLPYVWCQLHQIHASDHMRSPSTCSFVK